MREEAQKALPSLKADIMLKEMIEEISELDEAEDDHKIEDALEEIRAHISRVVMDYLKRSRVKGLSVESDISLEGSTIHCVLTMRAYERYAHKYLEFKA